MFISHHFLWGVAVTFTVVACSAPSSQQSSDPQGSVPPKVAVSESPERAASRPSTVVTTPNGDRFQHLSGATCTIPPVIAEDDLLQNAARIPVNAPLQEAVRQMGAEATKLEPRQDAVVDAIWEKRLEAAFFRVTLRSDRNGVGSVRTLEIEQDENTPCAWQILVTSK